MGGPGSGGARPNAGAKKKSPRQRMLAGTATPEERRARNRSAADQARAEADRL
jgi:hypothetical protein